MTLWGQEAVLDGLVPRLVGLDRTRNWHGRPEPAPVVQLLGSRASGKTALLDALREFYVRRTPLAWADLAAPGFGLPGVIDVRSREEPNASLLTHLLYVLLYRLSGGRQRMKFPRLALGLLVITGWEPGPPDGVPPPGSPDGVPPPDLQAAANRIAALLPGDDSSWRERRRLLGEWLTALARHLGALLGLPQVITDTVIETVRPLLLSGDPDEGTLRWWGRRLAARGILEADDLRTLFAFVGYFRTPATRPLAEEDLVAAFLADIRDHYGWRRQRDWTPRPLVLLDNAHAAPGPDLLSRLLACYAADPDTGEAIRPVVVGTALDDGLDPRPLPYRAVERDQPAGPVLRLAIPALSDAQIAAMLRRERRPAHLARPIARLSGGRAGCARLLVDNAGALATDPAVCDRLLARLLPRRQVREDLILLAPALDHNGARRLLGLSAGTRGGPDFDVAGRFQDVRDELAAGHWHHAPWQWPPGDLIHGTVPFVGDRALRDLLLHRQTVGASAGAAQLWSRRNLWLRQLYNPRALEPEDDRHSLPYLHHTLALGRLSAVERCLHHRLTRGTPEEWLTAVNLICAAPHPPLALVPPEDRAGCPSCDGDGGHAVTHQSIARLVAFLWRFSAPLSPLPDDDALTPVRVVWPVLDYRNPGQQNLFMQAGERWLTALARGTQAPDLRIPKD